MPNLTEPQARVLRRMRDGERLYCRTNFNTSRWFLGADSAHKATCQALLFIKGFIAQDGYATNGIKGYIRKYKLTDAGRRALAEYEGE